MYAGRIVEWAEKRLLFRNPAHPYTRGLFSSIPDLTKNVNRLTTIPGLPPDPTDLIPGCCFAPRCSLADEACYKNSPEMRELEPEHMVACFKTMPANSAQPLETATVTS